MATGTPPSDDGPRRRTDRLHGLVAGAVAVLAVLVGIFLVNLLNDPSEEGGSAASASSPTATVAPPASSAEPASPQAPPSASGPPTSAPATTTAPRSPSPAGTTPPDNPPATAQRVFTTVTIFNDSRIAGLAQEAIVPVEAAGFTVDRVGNFLSVYNTPVTTVFYDPEDEAAARTMLDTVPGVERMVPRSQTSILATGTLILVVTKDFPVNSE